jgi:glycosyltransferase involved in cell wall biosynthesis
MKIAIYHNLPSGGGKRALHEMVKRLSAHHDLDVYTLGSAEHDLFNLRPHCRRYVVFPFKALPLLQRPLGRLNQAIRLVDLGRLQRLQRQIARRIDANGYDVVYVHHCQYSQAPLLLQFLLTPSVYFCQEPPRSVTEPPVPRPYTELSRMQRIGNCLDPLPSLYRGVIRRLDRKSVLAASLVLANSAYSRESLYRTYGILSRVCYLGVDVEKFRPLGLDRGRFVLSVGALTPRKGFDFLIRSLALVEVAKRPPLLIVSNFANEPEHDYLLELSRELGVAVEFRVRIPDEQLVCLYNRARLTLYAPIMEPFGFVPIESMACGTPVVGVREGGVRESIVDSSTGRLTERDVAAFARAVDVLLDSPDLCQEYGRRGIDHVRETWSWERTLHTLKHHLDSVKG